MGDHYKDVKEYKASIRKYWNECPKCKKRFGTATLVAPGKRCRHDNWLSPGNIGDDVKSIEEK